MHSLFKKIAAFFLVCCSLQVTAAADGLRFTQHATNIPFVAAAVDYNRDGWNELFGTLNQQDNTIVVLQLEQMGLAKLTAQGRRLRDVRVADVNSDGFPDLISNTYTCTNEESSHALLFINNKDGTFSEDTWFTQAFGGVLRGKGETIIVADFDNDGYLDLYFPYYTLQENTAGYCTGYSPYVPSSRLLRNKGPFTVGDGAAHFEDITPVDSVSLTAVKCPTQPEGAQAIDFDSDGYIDLIVSGRIFLNNGDLTFTEKKLFRDAQGPSDFGVEQSCLRWEEGIKVFDWNNDGAFDIVLLDIVSRGHCEFITFGGQNCFAPKMLENDGTNNRFILREFATDTSGNLFFADRQNNRVSGAQTYGLNAADLNNDGLEDIVIMGGLSSATGKSDGRILINTGSGFVQSAAGLGSLGNGSGGPSFVDLDDDGRLEIAYPGNAAEGRGLTIFKNDSPLPASNKSFLIEMLGENGEQNQHGRFVRIDETAAKKGRARAVDSGSGYMAQTAYTMHVGVTDALEHSVLAFYAPIPSLGCGKKKETATDIGQPCVAGPFPVTADKHLKIYAPSASYPQGRYELIDRPRLLRGR